MVVLSAPLLVFYFNRKVPSVRKKCTFNRKIKNKMKTNRSRRRFFLLLWYRSRKNKFTLVKKKKQKNLLNVMTFKKKSYRSNYKEKLLSTPCDDNRHIIQIQVFK